MLRILHTPTFVRQYGDLSETLQEEVRARITLFQENPRNPSLRTHKLKGAMKDQWSFRVNYRYRVVFCYDDTHTVALLAVGNHSIYE